MSKKIYGECYFERSFNNQVQMYLLDSRKITDLIMNSTEDLVARNINTILSYGQNPSWFPTLTPQNIMSVYGVVGKERLASLANLIFENPEENHAGWPDIWVKYKGKLCFFEVKVKDSLLDTQIRAILHLIPLLGVTMQIIRVKRI